MKKVLLFHFPLSHFSFNFPLTVRFSNFCPLEVYSQNFDCFFFTVLIGSVLLSQIFFSTYPSYNFYLLQSSPVYNFVSFVIYAFCSEEHSNEATSLDIKCINDAFPLCISFNQVWLCDWWQLFIYMYYKDYADKMKTIFKISNIMQQRYCM